MMESFFFPCLAGRFLLPSPATTLQVVLLLFFAPPAAVVAEEGCEYSKMFVNASSSRFDIVVPNFDVEAGAKTTCKASCVSGSRTSLFLTYDGSASSDHFMDKDSDDYGCDLKASIRSHEIESTLGIFGLIQDPFIVSFVLSGRFQ